MPCRDGQKHCWTVGHAMQSANALIKLQKHQLWVRHIISTLPPLIGVCVCVSHVNPSWYYSQRWRQRHNGGRAATDTHTQTGTVCVRTAFSRGKRASNVKVFIEGNAEGTTENIVYTELLWLQTWSFKLSSHTTTRYVLLNTMCFSLLISNNTIFCLCYLLMLLPNVALYFASDVVLTITLLHYLDSCY